MVFDRIVAGVDECSQSRDAAALATALAAACRADLLLVSAYQDPLLPFPPGLVADSHRVKDAHAALTAVRSVCGSSAHSEVVADFSPVRGLRRAVRRDHADLLVLGSRSSGGRAGGSTLGHTARRLLRDAPCAVALAAQGIADAPVALRRIVVAVDDRPEAAAALGAARRLAEAAGARLEVVGVADDQVPLDPGPITLLADLQHWDEVVAAQRDALAEHLAGLVGDASVEISVRIGVPLVELTEAAAGADLLVVGARRHTAPGRLALGSTAAGLCDRAPCSVLAIPAPAAPPRSRHDRPDQEEQR